MTAWWSRFLKGWKAFWSPVGKFQTIVLLSVIYFLITPIFSLVRFSDPLKKRLSGDSFWTRRRPIDPNLERHRLPF